MILRENWKTAKKYLEYRQVVLQNDHKTIRSGWIALKHILQWLDDIPLGSAPRKRPTLPEYLLHARNDGKPDPLSPAHMAKVLTWARGLFEWLRLEHPTTYRAISPTWIETLQVRRSASLKSRLIRHQFWTLEDVLKVGTFPVNTLRMRRDRAALAFIFLSGMRGGAFVTMPVRSVDLQNMRVFQLPEWGVQTKNSKAAITYLLPIQELLDVVKDWDDYARSRASSQNTAWYTKMDYQAFDIVPDDLVGQSPVSGRRSQLYQGLRELCDLAGVEWKSIHKIRHGHGVYGRKRVKTMDEYKALSKNLMHDSIVTTDKIYADMEDDEVGNIISRMTPE